MKFILGKKVGMTTIFEEDGTAQNVSILEVGKNMITQIRTNDKDGYSAVQFGLLKKAKKSKKEGKSKNIFEKICEIRVDEKDLENYKAGDEIGVDSFEEEKKVKIVGTSKGKGFQGVVKRHGFKGSPASHGHRHDLRAPGSIGCAFPEHVLKGKKMAGRMGSDQVSVRNVKIVRIFKDESAIALKGALPGNNGSIVKIIFQD